MCHLLIVDDDENKRSLLREILGAHGYRLGSRRRAVGAMAFGELAAALEKSGKAGGLAEVRRRLPGFDAELARVQARIDAYLAGVQA